MSNDETIIIPPRQGLDYTLAPLPLVPTKPEISLGAAVSIMALTLSLMGYGGYCFIKAALIDRFTGASVPTQTQSPAVDRIHHASAYELMTGITEDTQVVNTLPAAAIRMHMAGVANRPHNQHGN